MLVISSACRYITDAPTITLPPMHLACLITEEELILESAEGEEGNERLK